MCFYCWPQQTNPHLKKPVNMHLYWSVGCYSFVTSVNDCCPSACSNTNSPILSWFNQYRAGQSHKPWTELMPNLWHRTGRTPAGQSLNNRAGQTHSKRKDRGTGRGDNDSYQANRLPGIMLKNIKSGSEEWVICEEKLGKAEGQEVVSGPEPCTHQEPWTCMETPRCAIRCCEFWFKCSILPAYS